MTLLDRMEFEYATVDATPQKTIQHFQPFRTQKKPLWILSILGVKARCVQSLENEVLLVFLGTVSTCTARCVGQVLQPRLRVQMGSFSDDLDELEETTPTPTTPKAAGFEAILLQKDDRAANSHHLLETWCRFKFHIQFQVHSQELPSTISFKV